MLEVQKFLSAGEKHGISDGFVLEALKAQKGIKYNIWEDKLVVLNYCQIESKKTCAIAQECRSLVLEIGTWEVVSRSFDRFFNYGEQPCPEIDIQYMTAYEKVDGSLIGLFQYKGEWLYRTRSMIMPENSINGWEVTWKERIEEALGESYKDRLGFTRGEATFILELTSRENRVVTKYACQTPQLTLLAIRHNDTGKYHKLDYIDSSFGGTFWGNILMDIPEWRMARTYKFETVSDCLTAAKELRDLQEGYVLYNRQGVPVCKVKNPAYVAAHHLRGEGLNPKRIKDLIIMNETDEYLAIFPEDAKMFGPYIEAYEHLMSELNRHLPLCHNPRITQKEFALSIKDLPFKSVLFFARKGRGIEESWKLSTTNTKYQLIDAMLNVGDLSWVIGSLHTDQ
jgi:hypothetical protein